jgi:hypothetical protein
MEWNNGMDISGKTKERKTKNNMMKVRRWEYG